MASTTTNNIYRKPYLSTAAYALGILLFLLPFFDIKCNNVSLAQVTGKDMVIGSEPKTTKEFSDLGKSFSKDDNEGNSVKTETPSQKGKIYIVAIIALALGVIGLVFSLVRKEGDQKVSMIVGVLGALALIGLWIQVSSDLKTSMKSKGDESLDKYSAMLNISVNVTFWFILCVLCYLVAAFISFQRNKLLVAGDIPPQNAPQLDLQNPGEQSEFLTSPSEERDLK